MLPFISARGPHADNAYAFTPEPGEHDNDNATDVYADCNPTLAGIVGRNDQGGVKKRFIQIGEIQTVLVEVSEALWLVPDDFHNYSVVTICFIVK